MARSVLRMCGTGLSLCVWSRRNRRGPLSGGIAHLSAALLLLLLAPILRSQTCPPDLSINAPDDRRLQVRAFQQALTSGPFYKELSRRSGKPLSCQLTLGDGIIKLTYSFRGKASLEAQANTGAESTDQRMQIRSIAEKTAMSLLKRAEKDTFGQDGCGIVWDKPAEVVPGDLPGSREVVYRGDACNCQARLVYAGKVIVGLIVRSAC